MAAITSTLVAERGLEAQVRSRALAVGGPVTLLEAVHDPESAPELLQLARVAISRLGPGEAVRRFPLVVGAVATEVGYAYEGVGTDFWPRFETATQAKLDMADRRAVGDAFRSLHQRLPLVQPVESAFNDVFSIIAWPLVHALMPRELAPAVSRLLARAPMRALPRRATPGDFAALRAWASAAEGQRLADWLKLEGPAGRVLAALLEGNAAGRLTTSVFARLSDAFRADWASFSALEGARARAVAPIRQTGVIAGRFSLRVNGTRAVLSVSWPPLPAALEWAARAEARVKGWRPRLWGRARTHAHNALGAGPIALELDGVLPSPETPAYPDAAEVFGPGSEIAAALASRHADWTCPLLFTAGDIDDPAEAAQTPLRGRTGRVFLLAEKDVRWAALRRVAELDATLVVREIDLADPAHREVLRQAGLWTEAGGAVLARRPVDAARLDRRSVAPGGALACWAAGEPAPRGPGEGAVLTARSPGPLGTAAGAVSVAAAVPPPPSVVEVIPAEVESAYDALTQRRLSVSLRSSWALRDIEARARLFIGDRLVVVSSARLEAAPGTIGPSHPLLAPLTAAWVLEALLAEGAGRLVIQVGRSATELPLERRRASLRWDAGGWPLAGDESGNELVSAAAERPAVFTASDVEAPSLRVVKLADGRLASPSFVQADGPLQASRIMPIFGTGSPSRRARDSGRGVAELAAARRAWADGECRSLGALAVRSRVVDAFERPLVRALCGDGWADAEAPAEASHWSALWKEARAAGLTQPPAEPNAALWDRFEAAFPPRAEASQPGWPEAGEVDGAALDEALNLAFADAVLAMEAVGLSPGANPEDADFGAPEEDWREAAYRAAHAVERHPLCPLLAPPSSVEGLRRRDYAAIEVQEAAVLLADWCRLKGSQRANLDEEGAMDALLFWLSPAASDDPERMAKRLARDRFTARTSRYLALRLGARAVG